MQSEQKSCYKKAHLKQQQALDSQITLLTQERDKRQKAFAALVKKNDTKKFIHISTRGDKSLKEQLARQSRLVGEARERMAAKQQKKSQLTNYLVQLQ